MVWPGCRTDRFAASFSSATTVASRGRRSPDSPRPTYDHCSRCWKATSAPKCRTRRRGADSLMDEILDLVGDSQPGGRRYRSMCVAPGKSSGESRVRCSKRRRASDSPTSSARAVCTRATHADAQGVRRAHTSINICSASTNRSRNRAMRGGEISFAGPRPRAVQPRNMCLMATVVRTKEESAGFSDAAHRGIRRRQASRRGARLRKTPHRVRSQPVLIRTTANLVRLPPRADGHTQGSFRRCQW